MDEIKSYYPTKKLPLPEDMKKHLGKLYDDARSLDPAIRVVRLRDFLSVFYQATLITKDVPVQVKLEAYIIICDMAQAAYFTEKNTGSAMYLTNQVLDGLKEVYEGYAVHTPGGMALPPPRSG